MQRFGALAQGCWEKHGSIIPSVLEFTFVCFERFWLPGRLWVQITVRSDLDMFSTAGSKTLVTDGSDGILL